MQSSAASASAIHAIDSSSDFFTLPHYKSSLPFLIAWNIMKAPCDPPSGTLPKLESV